MEGQEAAEEIKKMYDKLKVQVDAKEKLARANRQASCKFTKGQHVINESILETRDDIIRNFISQRMPHINIDDAILAKTNNMRYACKNTDFTGNMIDNIKNNMVAHISPDNYFDANELIYRVFLIFLRESATKHMIYLFDHPDVFSSLYEKALDQTCSMMNEKQIYVDQQARVEWIKCNRGRNQPAFNEALLGVSRMLSDLKNDISKWLNELKSIQ